MEKYSLEIEAKIYDEICKEEVLRIKPDAEIDNAFLIIQGNQQIYFNGDMIGFLKNAIDIVKEKTILS